MTSAGPAPFDSGAALKNRFLTTARCPRLPRPTCVLGGARPKATFTMQDGTLWLAKFPGHNDPYDWGSWEYLAYLLARDAGIVMPKAERVLLSDRYHTYCVSRFDRQAAIPGGEHGRRMYASAMTLLERRDGQQGASYLHILEAIVTYGGAGLTGDMHQLFRRAVFNLLVGNRDDHLRNHGFFLTPSGWRLSPAFDINPNPATSDHALTWDGKSGAPDLQILVATAGYYRLEAAEARAIVDEVTNVVATWRDRAAVLDLSVVETRLMSSVFAVG